MRLPSAGAEFARDRALRARWSGRRCSAAHRAGRAPGRRSSGRCRGRRGSVPQWSALGRVRRAAPASVRIDAQEQPGAELAADQVGVLALPAQAGALGQRLLHQRRGVDEHLQLAAEARGHPAGQLLQPPLDQLVIVVALGVDRDRRRGRGRPAPPADRRPGRSSRPARWPSARSAHMARGVGAALGGLGHPAHLAVAAGVDELAPAARRRGQASSAEAKRQSVEAQLGGACGADQRRSVARLRSRGRHSARAGARPGQRSASSGRKHGRDFSFMYQVFTAGKSRQGTSPK